MEWITPETFLENRIWLFRTATHTNEKSDISGYISRIKKILLSYRIEHHIINQNVCLFGYGLVDEKYILGIYEHEPLMFRSYSKIHAYYFDINDGFFHFKIPISKEGENFTKNFICRSIDEFLNEIEVSSCYVAMPNPVLRELKDYLIHVDNEEMALNILQDTYEDRLALKKRGMIKRKSYQESAFPIRTRGIDIYQLPEEAPIKMKGSDVYVNLLRDTERGIHPGYIKPYSTKQTFLNQKQKEKFAVNNIGILYSTLDNSYDYYIIHFIRTDSGMEYSVLNVVIMGEYAMIKDSDDPFDSIWQLAEDNNIVLLSVSDISVELSRRSKRSKVK